MYCSQLLASADDMVLLVRHGVHSSRLLRYWSCDVLSLIVLSRRSRQREWLNNIIICRPTAA